MSLPCSSVPFCTGSGSESYSNDWLHQHSRDVFLPSGQLSAEQRDAVAFLTFQSVHSYCLPCLRGTTPQCSPTQGNFPAENSYSPCLFSGVESKHMLNVYRRKQGLLVFKPSAQERCVFCNPGDEDAVSMSSLMSSRTQNKPWKSCLLHCHPPSACAWALHLLVSRWAELHSKNVTKARGQPQVWSVQQDLY